MTAIAILDIFGGSINIQIQYILLGDEKKTAHGAHGSPEGNPMIHLSPACHHQVLVEAFPYH